MRSTKVPAGDDAYVSLFDEAQAAVRDYASGSQLDLAATAAFGPDVSGADVASAVQTLDRKGWPKLVLVDEDELHGARGAYDSQHDTIYLSRDFAATASSAEVIAVLIEEIGHALDGLVHGVDAAGDEGAIFAQYVLGDAPSSADLAALQAENDHSTVDIGGESVAVELAAPVVGAVTLDGSLSDWTAAYQIDTTGSTTGYDIYARFTGDSYVFALKAPVAIGANTTEWLNTDKNAATGYQIFGSTGGAEYNINFDATGTPYLYTGAAGQTLVSGATVSFGYSADRTVVEFAVAKSALGGSTAINTLWDVNDSTFLPGNYATTQYEVHEPGPPRTDFTKNIGIVYSDTSANSYFSKMAYSQLFMAAQNQAAMAGVRYEILTESDLTNLSKLVNFDAIVFPEFSHVQSSQAAAIESTLSILSEDYHVGLIASGEFMVYNQNNQALSADPYARMKSLFGLNIAGSGFPADVTLKAGDATGNTTHAMIDSQDYTTGEVIRNYSGVGWLEFAPTGAGASVVATQTVNNTVHNAVVVTQTGGTNVHFSTNSVMGDNNLLWQAIDYATHGSGVTAGIQLSRNSVIVATRVDMDQAMEMVDVNPENNAQGIYDKMIPVLQQWKAQYNFVGSYYVDIGNNPTEEQMTDWSVSAPYYKALLDMGNELGSHSYTHPADTNALSAAQIQSEFQGSKQIIEQQMSAYLGTPFVVDGAAVPGNPENLPTALAISQYYNYLSGGYSSINAGYPGAFGYLNPAMAGANKVYLAPNMSFDFSLVEFQHLTPTQAAAAWQNEWNQLTTHSDVPVLLWPLHDYSIATWSVDPPTPSPYTQAMFTDFISKAYARGAEFVTLDDLAERISSFGDSGVRTTVSGNTVTAVVTSPDAGKFALDLDNLGSLKIANVTNWYAYDNDSVFLPQAGGTFTINLGASATDVTHITSLPMRAELLSVSGDGTNLNFSVIGEGRAVIDLVAPAGRVANVTGATFVSLVGDQLTIDLGDGGQDTVSITLTAANVAPTITSNGGGASASISLAENTSAVTTVVATDQNAGNTLTYFINGGNDAARFTIDAGTGALRFVNPPDYEAPTDQGANNVYNVTVGVRDNAGLTDTQALAVTVTNVNSVNLTGTNSANTLTGTSEPDTLTGRGGNDTLYGLDGSDTLDGGTGDDLLVAGSGLWTDVLRGGAGNDIYELFNVGSQVIENAGEGTDTVRSFAWNTTLWANVENLVLYDPVSNTNGTGNELNNVITGNAGNNILRGLDGSDTLNGGAGDDTLYAGSGLWTDVLAGGAGNDTYELFNVDSQVIENAGQGTDTVRSFAWNTTLWANVENLVLVDPVSNTNGTGNALNNVITGNAGNNILRGLDGSDTLNGGAGDDTLYAGSGLWADVLAGGAGNDTYELFNVDSQVIENAGEGTDTVRSFAWNTTLWANVENLVLYDPVSNTNGTGNALANVITGNAGNNVLTGLGGADVLTGRGGADRFDYNSISDGLDTITDFTRGAGNDSLDFRDVLVGYSPGSSNPAAFVQLSQSGGNTTVSVNADGVGTDFVSLVVLQGVTGATVSDMIAQGNLILA